MPERQLARSDGSPMAWAKAAGAVVLMVALYYLIKWLTGVLAIYPHLGLPEKLTKPGSWVRAFDHHFWQMTLALVLIALVARGRWRDWGLNLRNASQSLRLTWRFCYYYGLYFVGIGFLVQLLFMDAPPQRHDLCWTQITGHLAFGFLFVGLSEEILFRGMMHTYLARYWTGIWRWKNIEMPVAGVIAAIIFTVAHIGFTLSPFEIWHLKPLQLVQAFVLGLVYSWAYHRTRSLLAPILMHNFSDGSLWVSEYMLIWFRS